MVKTRRNKKERPIESKIVLEGSDGPHLITHASIVKKDHFNRSYTKHLFVPITEIMKENSQERHIRHLDPSHDTDFIPGAIYYREICEVDL